MIGRESDWEAVISIPEGVGAGVHASLKAPSRQEALERAFVFLGGMDLDDNAGIEIVVRNVAQ